MDEFMESGNTDSAAAGTLRLLARMALSACPVTQCHSAVATSPAYPCIHDVCTYKHPRGVHKQARFDRRLASAGFPRRSPPGWETQCMRDSTNGCSTIHDTGPSLLAAGGGHIQASDVFGSLRSSRPAISHESRTLQLRRGQQPAANHGHGVSTGPHPLMLLGMHRHCEWQWVQCETAAGR